MIFYFSCSSEKTNDWNEENINGKVESYEEKSFNVVNDEKQEKSFVKEIKNFDQKGKIVEEYLYEFDGVGSRFVPKYDEKGYKTEMFCYSTQSNKLVYKWLYTYDDNGNKIKDEIYNSGNQVILERDFKYDQKGNKIESIEKYKYNPEGVVKKKTFEYNDNNENSKTTTYDPFGKKIKNFYTFVYDKDGNKIEENIHNSNGKLTSKWIYKYEFDNQGNWIKKTEFDQGLFPKNIIERTYKYYN
ncbi:hypothetical protein [Tenacibaculum jejuense]|nr:hypothetical protein [Tenacibaculum jejuense]